VGAVAAVDAVLPAEPLLLDRRSLRLGADVLGRHCATAPSAGVTINVRPRVGFGLQGRRGTVKVTGRDSFAGSLVLLQRHRRLSLGQRFRVFSRQLARAHH
jgi:hypothetical protein